MKKILYTIIIIIGSVSSLFVYSQKDITLNKDVNSYINDLNYYSMTDLLLEIHMQINQGNMNSDLSDFGGTLNKMKEMSNLDVIKYIGYSNSIEQSLDGVIVDLSNLLEKSSNSQLRIKNQLLTYKNKKDSCDNKKLIYEKNTILALEDLDIKNIQYYLDKTIENDECSVEFRIKYNFMDKMLDEFIFFDNVLQRKYIYLINSREKIIADYDKILNDYLNSL